MFWRKYFYSLFNIEIMARKKAKHNFLTEEEVANFIAFVQENKISQTKMAEIQGVSAGTISNWFAKNEILKALRDNVERYVENPQLKAKLKKAREGLE
ncbi:MAG: hypothetical protein EBS06_05365 [Proteobacteria bacterium]|nr:hypothetical protein [Pseudomonadota bacterium]